MGRPSKHRVEVRARAVRLAATPMHRQSLLNIPLVREAWHDKRFKKRPRAIDTRWSYRHRNLPSVSGFNPFLSSFYYGRLSNMADWFERPEGSARKLNERDLLIKEVLIFAHDYLHWWCYGLIAELAPSVGFGVEPISPRNLEDYLFCHLLSEAVATVGLDYWYLSTVELNDVCDLGSRMGPLTVYYRSRWEPEYRRFHAAFTAQEPRFLETLCRFYCDGRMPGFSLAALKESPQVLGWLEHELEYGLSQREYARLWFSFLGGAPAVPAAELSRAVRTDRPWQRSLMRQVGELLWAKVKDGKELITPRVFDGSAIFDRSPARLQRIDLRFVNLNRLDPSRVRTAIAELPDHDTQFRYLTYQYLSQHDISSFDPELVKLIPIILEKKDFGLLAAIFRHARRLPAERGEPRDLFLLG